VTSSSTPGVQQWSWKQGVVVVVVVVMCVGLWVWVWVGGWVVVVVVVGVRARARVSRVARVLAQPGVRCRPGTDDALLAKTPNPSQEGASRIASSKAH
jgi:hypothetical protein